MIDPGVRTGASYPDTLNQEYTVTCKLQILERKYFTDILNIHLIFCYCKLIYHYTLLLKYLYAHGQKGKSNTMQNKNKLFSLCMVNCSLASFILLCHL